VISIGSGTSEYSASSLPANYVPSYSIFPYWDDTFIYQGQPQGLFYLIEGTKISIECYLSHYGDARQYYHYIVVYDSATPGIFTYSYYQISDSGISATVGVQGMRFKTLTNRMWLIILSGGTQFSQFSYHTNGIIPGLNLVVDTTLNKITAFASSVGVCAPVPGHT
jgi:hypothetical protein